MAAPYFDFKEGFQCSVMKTISSTKLLRLRSDVSLIVWLAIIVTSVESADDGNQSPDSATFSLSKRHSTHRKNIRSSRKNSLNLVSESGRLLMQNLERRHSIQETLDPTMSSRLQGPRFEEAKPLPEAIEPDPKNDYPNGTGTLELSQRSNYNGSQATIDILTTSEKDGFPPHVQLMSIQEMKEKGMFEEFLFEKGDQERLPKEPAKPNPLDKNRDKKSERAMIMQSPGYTFLAVVLIIGALAFVGVSIYFVFIWPRMARKKYQRRYLSRLEQTFMDIDRRKPLFASNTCGSPRARLVLPPVQAPVPLFEVPAEREHAVERFKSGPDENPQTRDLARHSTLYIESQKKFSDWSREVCFPEVNGRFSHPAIHTTFPSNAEDTARDRCSDTGKEYFEPSVRSINALRFKTK